MREPKFVFLTKDDYECPIKCKTENCFHEEYIKFSEINKYAKEPCPNCGENLIKFHEIESFKDLEKAFRKVLSKLKDLTYTDEFTINQIYKL